MTASVKERRPLYTDQLYGTHMAIFSESCSVAVVYRVTDIYDKILFCFLILASHQAAHKGQRFSYLIRYTFFLKYVLLSRRKRGGISCCFHLVDLIQLGSELESQQDETSIVSILYFNLISKLLLTP